MQLSWRINAERMVVFGWSRAILMQLAHPLVAAGVDDHSTFRVGALSAARRLHHTVMAMLSLTFGDAAARHQTLDAIRAIHRRVNGTLPEDVGRFRAGTAYSAEDPRLLLWVHVTLVDSIVLLYDLLVEPLSLPERDRYCAEGAPVAIALGARDEEVPRTWDGVRRHIQTTIDSHELAVGAQARTLAEALLAPPLAGAVWPAAWVNRLITIGMLPPPVRAQYGWRWTPANERQLRATLAVLRSTRQLLPQVMAWWPQARRQTLPPTAR